MQQQQADEQVLVESLRQQVRDATSQLNTSAASCERLTTSLTRESERADDLQRKLDQADAQIKNKARFFSWHERIYNTHTHASSSSLFGMHHQCVAPLAANSPHSGLSRAISIASAKVRLCRDRSFFRVAIQEEWGRPTGLLQSLWESEFSWRRLTHPF